MNVKLQSSDDEVTLLMNVWLAAYLEEAASMSPSIAASRADAVVQKFKERFLSK